MPDIADYAELDRVAGREALSLAQRTGRLVESVVMKLGKAVSLLIIVIMLLTTWEVVSRYAFNRPTSWAWIINRQLFAVFALVGGAFTMAHGMHIRIEMLYDRFPQRVQFAVRCLSLICLLGFLGVLVWKGALLGWDSFVRREVATGVFSMPLYPVKLFIPVAALLFILEGLVCFFRKKL